MGIGWINDIHFNGLSQYPMDNGFPTEQDGHVKELIN